MELYRSCAVQRKDKLYKQYHGIIDQLFDRFNINASNKKLSNFRSNISNIQGSGTQSLYREREKLVRTYENMKNELQTYENNLGFLTSTSKKGSSLLTELNRKVDKLKADLELVLQKIKVIDESIKQKNKSSARFRKIRNRFYTHLSYKTCFSFLLNKTTASLRIYSLSINFTAFHKISVFRTINVHLCHRICHRGTVF